MRATSSRELERRNERRERRSGGANEAERPRKGEDIVRSRSMKKRIGATGEKTGLRHGGEHRNRENGERRRVSDVAITSAGAAPDDEIGPCAPS